MTHGMLLVVAAVSAPFPSMPARDDLVKIEDPKSVISDKELITNDYRGGYGILLFRETFRADGSWRFYHAGVGVTEFLGSWTQNERGEVCVTYDAGSKCRAFYKSAKNPGYVFVEPARGERQILVRMRLDTTIH